eukprot:gnl/MRDRNA2_/MRDRNA2_89404_c0_seq1.p1 gnl/MRDRNA2_/MRDRNA2_89404_c0~~gnl/MRDRNA2_/MRDRNA2_89404_c0_seq1.p1  ORF type:complete len:510 (-),score=130.62 gnl/MRDRNA2_/MRDRNA2_89404_c0_seq1:6-1475(-)
MSQPEVGTTEKEHEKREGRGTGEEEVEVQDLNSFLESAGQPPVEEIHGPDDDSDSEASENAPEEELTEEQVIAADDKHKKRAQALKNAGYNEKGKGLLESCLGGKQRLRPKKMEAEKPLSVIFGWLAKTSPRWFVGKQWRWFELRDKRLSWWNSQDECQQKKKALGNLDFELLDVEVKKLWENRKPSTLEAMFCGGATRKASRGSCVSGWNKDHDDFSMSVKNSNRIFQLQAESADLAAQWLPAIEEHIAAAAACGHRPCQIAELPKKFWKYKRISPEKFEDMCNTGDIMLFRAKSSDAKLQRAFTGAHFDHVGIILKFAGGEIAFLEAHGGEGVGLCTWSEFVENEWQTLYPEMVLRRVYCPRSDETIVKFFEWTKEVVGKPYKISYDKLTRRVSSHKEEDFFCSELVATGLKHLGVLKEGTASSSYWPGTFAENNDEHLAHEIKDGCSLGIELLLDFSLAEEGSAYHMPTGHFKAKKGGFAMSNFGF